MGAKNSAPVAQKQATQMVQKPVLNNMTKQNVNIFDLTSEELMEFDISTILHEVDRIPKPKTATPIACLVETSTPILLAPFRLTSDLAGQEEEHFNLPIFAISRCELARVMCLGDGEILALCNENVDTYVLFLEKMMKWIAGTHPLVRTALVSNHLGDLSDAILYNMRALGFGFEMLTDDMSIDYSKYAFVIAESSFDRLDGLDVFLSNGGGILCIPSPPNTKNRFNINSVISQFGLGFLTSPFEFLNQNDDFQEVSLHSESFSHDDEQDSNLNYFKTAVPFELLREQIFPILLKAAMKLITKDGFVNVALFDTMVRLIWHNIELLNPGQCEELTAFCDATLQYLQFTNYQVDGIICPNPVQGIAVMALTEAFSKMSSHEASQYNVGSLFPGISNQFLDEKMIQVTIRDNRWYSNGFYLPPGAIGLISFPKFAPNLFVQIGCHPQFIGDKPCPWKRWPMITIKYEVERPQIEIVSPYGGLIYFYTNQKDLPKPIKFAATLIDVARCPFYNIKKPKKWEKTMDNDVPWAEIEFQYIAFSVPSFIARQSPDLDNLASFLDEMVDVITRFYSNPLVSLHYRVVFDVELPTEGYVCGYPIVMDFAVAQAVFGEIRPSKELFQMLMLIGIYNLPENMFTNQFEIGLASASALYALSKKFPQIQPFEYIDGAAGSAKEFWAILQNKGETIFKTVHEEINSKKLELKHLSQTEAADYYLTSLSKLADEDYSHINKLITGYGSNFSFILQSQSGDDSL